ncbi:hypothetical protein E4634_16270 [Mangrovimicrobium sediminis]|uniref:Uncharacterized protein n=1 Tax=Mangrovimicrobium sediminis TaxID=2562682 RepID=A0A4Z0LYA1_9GAMM|nr:hypothetical protein [Haliea sp. SAOS-164]TGD72220.1 hypothetical protein E4634_16270 [Haliea sp. SAOS-164]
MLSELAGFNLTRTIPDSVLLDVLTGANKIYGGVVRNNSGQIVAHLVNSANPISLLNFPFAPSNLALAGANTYQLHRIGQNIDELMVLAKGTMAMSGLTLGVCTAGFLFLNHKLGKVDQKLGEISKDVKAIKSFLEQQERARLVTALKSLRGLDQGTATTAREQILINSKQTLGEIHEKYRDQLERCTVIEEAFALEEYYTVTALGHALCFGELDMSHQARNDLREAYDFWAKTVKRILREQIIKDDPERFLRAKYVSTAKAIDLTTWMDFINDTNKELNWIDEFRAAPTPLLPSLSKTLDDREQLEVDLMRKLVARDNVYEGYVSQYDYYATIEARPSAVQQYIESVPAENSVNECLMFLNSDLSK